MDASSPKPSWSTLLEKLDPASEAHVREQIDGALRTQALYVAAKLGVADQLAKGPLSAQAIAQSLAVNTDALRRVLRYLVSRGIFRESAAGVFSLNATAEYLQSQHPRSLRQSAIRAGEGWWRTVGALMAATRTGRPPREGASGIFFEQLAATDKVAAFAARMASSSDGIGEAIAALPCLAGVRTVVDVGGGAGHVLGEILKHRDELRGILFERAETIALAQERLARESCAARCQIIAGDFFSAVPAADVHVLSWILHDWSDEDAVRILRACRSSVDIRGRLLVVEVISPDVATLSQPSGRGVGDPFALDMQMLLLTGGRERSRAEFEALLATSGYELITVHAVRSTRGASVLEARPAA
jgi:hypothetical protein